MKLSVRRKVANGLVICLLAPKAATMASDAMDSAGTGFEAFSAEDNFDLAVGNGGGSQTRSEVTVRAVPTDDPCDPSGADPSGFTTTCVDPDPSGNLPAFCYKAPTTLVTAEDGSTDLIEVYSGEDPSGTHFYQVMSSSSDPSGGAYPRPTAVAFGENACEPQQVWIHGRNDGMDIGDRPYTISFKDAGDNVVGAVAGVNLDNDNYASVIVEVLGPNSLPVGGSGEFDIRVSNVTRAELPDSNLLVIPTPGLTITGFAATLFGGGPFDTDGKIKSGVLEFKKFSLAPGDVLLLTVEATLNSASPNGEKLAARVVNSNDSGIQSDDDWITEAALP